MKKVMTYLIMTTIIASLITGCVSPLPNKNPNKSLEDENITTDEKYEYEYDKNMIPENEKLLFSKGFHGNRPYEFSLITHKGIENITDVPLVDIKVPRSSFYDDDKLCGFYLNSNDEAVIYFYDINTKSYKEILKEFNYKPQKSFFNVSSFKNNTLIALGENDKGFTVFDLNSNIATHVTVKLNQKEFYISNAQIYDQGYFVNCYYEIGDKWDTEQLFVDKSGNIIKRYQIPNVKIYGSNYMELSPDASLLLYSIGKTGDNRYLYDFNTDTVYVLYDNYSPGTCWSSDGKSIYYINYIGKHDNLEKWNITKKDIKEIIINK